LEFAAQAVTDALAALCVDPNRLPGFTPHRKGKIEFLSATPAAPPTNKTSSCRPSN